MPTNPTPAERLQLQPIDFKEACAFVASIHRHHKPPQGHKFSIAVNDGKKVVGVAMVGRPISRNLDDGWTLEVNRLATDGTRNACSMLYRAAWKAAKNMGFKRLVTYTLKEEGGASLRACGARLVGEAGGGTWSRSSRPRVDTHPLQTKLFWEFVS